MNCKVFLSIALSCLALVLAGPISQPLTAIGTCPPRDTNVTIYLPDSEDCTVYYVCSNGRPIKVSCAPGMSWNTDLNTCDWNINVECPNSNENGTTKNVIRSVQGTCPDVDPATPVFFPDSKSCEIYYECSNGEAIQNECPPGLEFNPKKNVCDFPNVAGCTASIKVSKKVVRSVQGTCPDVDPATPVFFPDSESCTIYYECSNGEAIPNECPPGLEFNPKKNVCDFPNVAGCTASIKFSKEVARSVQGTCPAVDPATPVFFPDSDSCEIYYECSNGEAILNECPPGLEFNPKKNFCDFPNVAGCTASIKVSKKVVRSVQGTCPAVDPATPVFFPDSDSCAVYYECSNGEAIPNECPPGLEFNPKKNVCDFPNVAGCTASFKVSKKVVRSVQGTCPAVDPATPVFFPDSESCTIYYECSNGEAIPNECPPGLEFNPKKNVCDFPNVAGCTASIKVSKKVARSVQGTCPAVDPATPVFFPDSDSCSIYYECSNGEAIPNECPPGLEFNPKKNVCDFPNVAGCTASKSS